ncbi:MAG: hypothetical protein HY904_00445 [Deltaproteobacteria bacterium]|nr:hypothetical protein [Deltaproteobacteria bacterium]
MLITPRRRSMFSTALFALLVASPVRADQDPATDNVGALFPYTGMLEKNGMSISGPVEMRLALYDGPDPASGTPQPVSWEETQTVQVYGGRFSVLLGLCDQVPADGACPDGDLNPLISLQQVLLYADDLHLGIVLYPRSANPVPLLGRKRLLPVPYAAWSRAASDLRVARDLSVAGSVNVVGNVSASGLVLGDALGIAGYRGIAFDGLDNVNGYALAQAANGSETLINAPTGGAVRARINNATRVSVDVNAVDVSGRLLRDEFVVSCAAGLSGAQFAFCCRMNVRNGATECKRTVTNWDSWAAIPSPFAAGSAGPYSLSCAEHVSGVNWPACCRSNASGTVECRLNSTSFMDGAWTAGANPW